MCSKQVERWDRRPHHVHSPGVGPLLPTRRGCYFPIWPPPFPERTRMHKGVGLGFYRSTGLPGEEMHPRARRAHRRTPPPLRCRAMRGGAGGADSDGRMMEGEWRQAVSTCRLGRGGGGAGASGDGAEANRPGCMAGSVTRAYSKVGVVGSALLDLFPPCQRSSIDVPTCITCRVGRRVWWRRSVGEERSVPGEMPCRADCRADAEPSDVS